MWRVLAQEFPSRIYYPSFVAFLANPPEIDEYDLIGGHLPLSVISQYLAPGDQVLGLMREPTERLLLAFRHSRRPWEDQSTFTATMRAMRDRPFREFIQTESGKFEAFQQLIMLGGSHEKFQSSSDQQTYLAHAQKLLSSDQYVFAPCSRSGEFFALMAQRYDVKRKQLRTANQNDYASPSTDIAEFYDLLDLLQSINATEHRLYEFVTSRFDTIGLSAKSGGSIRGSGRRVAALGTNIERMRSRGDRRWCHSLAARPKALFAWLNRNRWLAKGFAATPLKGPRPGCTRQHQATNAAL